MTIQKESGLTTVNKGLAIEKQLEEMVKSSTRLVYAAQLFDELRSMQKPHTISEGLRLAALKVTNHIIQMATNERAGRAADEIDDFEDTPFLKYSIDKNIPQLHQNLKKAGMEYIAEKTVFLQDPKIQGTYNEAHESFKYYFKDKDKWATMFFYEMPFKSKLVEQDDIEDLLKSYTDLVTVNVSDSPDAREKFYASQGLVDVLSAIVNDKSVAYINKNAGISRAMVYRLIDGSLEYILSSTVKKLQPFFKAHTDFLIDISVPGKVDVIDKKDQIPVSLQESFDRTWYQTESGVEWLSELDKEEFDKLSRKDLEKAYLQHYVQPKLEEYRHFRREAQKDLNKEAYRKEMATSGSQSHMIPINYIDDFTDLVFNIDRESSTMITRPARIKDKDAYALTIVDNKFMPIVGIKDVIVIEPNSIPANRWQDILVTVTKKDENTGGLICSYIIGSLMHKDESKPFDPKNFIVKAQNPRKEGEIKDLIVKDGLIGKQFNWTVKNVLYIGKIIKN